MESPNKPPEPPNARPGPRLVSPTPIVITIRWNELTGQVDFATTRDIPFPALMMIFAQLTTTFVRAQMAPPPQPPISGLKPQ